MSSFKMSTLSDHAFPMHLHLHPQTAQLYLCLSTEAWCMPQQGWGRSCCAFLQTQIFKSNSVELRHSMEQGKPNQVLLWFSKNANTDYCLCEPPDPPGLGLAQRVFWYPCMRPAGSFCPHVSSLGENSRTEMHSLPTCCQWYSWNQDGIRSNFFHQRY